MGGVLCILHEIVDHLAQLSLVALNVRHVGRQRQADGPDGTGFAFIEAHDFLDERVEIDLDQHGWRRLGVFPEIIDHVFHRGNLIDDGRHTARKHAGVSRFKFAGQFHAQTLGRQLDRRERILDLVGQTTGHLSPGHGALC